METKGTAVIKIEKRDHINRLTSINNLDQYMADAMDSIEKREKFLEYRKKWTKTMELNFVPEFPLHLELDLIDTCNLKCEVCTRSYDRGTKDKITFEQYKIIVDDCVSNGIYSINHGVGSEPTLHPDIIKMVAYAKQAGVLDIIVGTNGQVMNENETVELVKAGVTRIGFSIDAATSETYFNVRKANLDKVEKNVMAVAEYKRKNGLKLPILRVTFVKYHANEHEVQDFIQKWSGIVDYIDVQNYIPVPPKDMSIDSLNDFKCKDFKCPQPFQRLTILVDGTVYPCCTFYSKLIPLGNIKYLSLKDMWLSDNISKLRNELLNKAYNKICKNCYGSQG